MQKLTKTRAIDLALEQWLDTYENGTSVPLAHDRVAREAAVPTSLVSCFLCYVSKRCRNCPCVIVTGVECKVHSGLYFRGDPESAVSLLLAIQDEWQRRYSRNKA